MTKPKEGISAEGKKMHYSVGALIRNKKGEILLLDRTKPPFGWAGPAGHVDKGERHQDAIRREVKEETGYKVTSIKKFLYEEEISGNRCNRGISTHYWHLYECRVTGKMKRNKSETKGLSWFSEDEILGLEIEPVWKHWFKRIGIINKEITICGSVDFTPAISRIKKMLEGDKNLVNIPYFTKKILNGEMEYEEYMDAKRSGGDIGLRNNEDVDFFFRYHEFIKRSDAILVLNMKKNGIENYIGFNTGVEIYSAYINDKPIYFYNPIPERSEAMHYVDELKDFNPIIINGDLSLIK